MGELFDYFKERYLRSDRSEVADMMERSKVKNTINELCSTYLKDAGDIFEFEVSKNDLTYAVEVVEEEPLKSMYDIYQISPTIFRAKLKELDL